MPWNIKDVFVGVQGKAKAGDGNGSTRARIGEGGEATAVSLPDGYHPSEDERFMSPRQRKYFRRRLLAWRNEILAESRETILNLQEHSPQEPDIADRASIESGRLIELRTRDRERKLLSKIDTALRRIEDGTYGFCVESGEPISLRRLEARPIATLGIDAQERHERLEKTYRDD
jgi:DnaK suppressor protein